MHGLAESNAIPNDVGCCSALLKKLLLFDHPAVPKGVDLLRAEIPSRIPLLPLRIGRRIYGNGGNHKRQTSD
jgi:hypothetical protein